MNRRIGDSIRFGLQVFPLLVGMTLYLIGAGVEAASKNRLDFAGNIALETRYFFHEPIHVGQSDEEWAPSVSAQPELRYWFNNREDILALVLFGRYEEGKYDPDRKHWDIRQMDWRHSGRNWYLQAGISQVFWGTVESRRLVDIINQKDTVDNVDRDDKLGQPLILLGWQNTWGTVEGYFMPYFREGTFPGRKGRLRGPYPVDIDQVIYESDQEEKHLDYALRYQLSKSVFDIGLSYFRGTGREARVTLGYDNEGLEILIPHYDIIEQYSLDMQATIDAWLLKLETYKRINNPDNFWAYVAGFEYTFFNIGQSNQDIGVILETIYDGREFEAPPTTFDDELFAGVRWSKNDLDNTSVLFGVITDTNTGSVSAKLEFNTRYKDLITCDLEISFFDNVDESEMVLYAARRDTNVRLRLAYNF